MGTFVSNVVILNIILRLLSFSSLEGLQTERSIREGEYWREKALAAPRASFRKIHYYERAIKADHGSATSHLELAEVYFELAISYGHHDLYENAEEELRNALKEDPSLVQAHYRLGMLYFMRGDFRQSRIELEKAHRLDPNYLPAVNSLRMLREEVHKKDERSTSNVQRSTFNEKAAPAPGRTEFYPRSLTAETGAGVTAPSYRAL